MAAKLVCGMYEGSAKPDTPRPSESGTEPPRGTHEVWINTKELGWFRSAIRSSREAAEQLAEDLSKNYEVEVR